MKILYLDTSIIISFIKIDDIFHELSKKLMNAKNFERIASPISIIEISSEISRQFESLKYDTAKITDWDNLNQHERKIVIISYFLEKLPIDFYSCLGTEKIYLKNQELGIHIDFSKAFKMAPFFPIRTLDNLQIAAALNLRDVKNFKIDYFVTTDSVILDYKTEIQKLTHLTVIHPKKLIEVENL